MTTFEKCFSIINFVFGTSFKVNLCRILTCNDIAPRENVLSPRVNLEALPRHQSVILRPKFNPQDVL